MLGESSDDNEMYDSEDEESDDDQGSSETAAEQWLREQLYQPYPLYQHGEL